MSRQIKQKKKETESVAASLKKFFHYLLNGMICIYMLLILAVLPFYHTDGYSHIGTNKSNFFNQASVICGKLLVPVLLCYLIVTYIVYRQEQQGEVKHQGEVNIFEKTLLQRFSVTDIFAGLYGISLLLSYACSDYKDTALWGANWWFMGLYPQLFLLSIYFLISRLWRKCKWLPFVVLPVSGIVFLLGYLNRFGIYPIDMKVDNVQFISTIGNINWYCGYLVSVFFGGVFLLWQKAGKKIWQQALLMLYVAVGFATLVTQGSSSGIVTMAVMLLVFFCLSASDSGRMLQFWQIALILSAVCLGTFCIRQIFPEQLTYIESTTELLTNSALPVIMAAVSVILYVSVYYSRKRGYYPEKAARMLAKAAGIGAFLVLSVFVVMICINTLQPGSLGGFSEMSIFTFSPTWGSNRGTTWKAGLMCFAEQDFLHKLVGAGPDCMSAFLYFDGSEELVSLVNERFGSNVKLTNAHNEWITILVNMGLLGFISYVGMIVSAIVRFVKKRNVNYIAAAVGFCLLAYTVNNMFSFQQAMNVSTMFVIFGIGEAYAKKE